MPTFRAALVRLLGESVSTKRDQCMSCHTRLVQALVLDDRYDSYRFPDTLDICGRIILVLSYGGAKLRQNDALESVRHLILPASTLWSLLDLVDVLTIAIAQTWLAILRLALLCNFCATDNLCGSAVSTKAIKVGSRSGGGRTHATRRAFCCIDDSRDAHWGIPPKRS